jgi:PIN domain nuclease of toxin-antitoxin system
VLWWQAGGERLSSVAAQRIERADLRYLSPISCWEIAMLVSKDRIALDRPVGAWINDVLATNTVDSAELTPQVAVTAGRLEDFPGDPADRIIYATAVARQVPLVTKDAGLLTFARTSGDVRAYW